MGGKHNKCCCSPAGAWLYVGHTSNSTIYRVAPSDGAYTTFSTGVVSNVRSLSCDPTTDLIYVAGSQGEIYCLNSSGGVVWNVTKGGGALIYDVCVSNDGHVYAAFSATGGTGAIFKLDALTGTEITSGWPYSPGGGASFECVSVDQSGNVYAGGGNTARTVKALSLTSGGTVRWTSPVRNVGDSVSNNVHGLAVNALGTEVIAQRTINTLSEPTLHSHYLLDATTGGITNSFRPTSRNGVFADGCDYDALHHPHATVSVGASGTADVYIDLTTGLFNTNSSGPFGIACTRDGGVFVVGQSNLGVPYNMWSVHGGWKFKIGGLASLYTIESSEGRAGAFGI